MAVLLESEVLGGGSKLGWPASGQFKQATGRPTIGHNRGPLHFRQNL